MRILFVTRKYPPSTGGMELAAYELYTALAANKDNTVALIKWGGANKMLPIIYPWLLLRALLSGLRKRPDVIYLQDGMMAPLGLALKWLLRRPTLMTIHGKEVTYENKLYRAIVFPAIRRQNLLVAVSSDTERALRRVFPKVHTRLILNGVSDNYYASDRRDEQYTQVAAMAGMTKEALQKRKLILTVGRLVRRKGVLWFIENALADLVKLDPSVLYLVSGEGGDREAIKAAIAARGLEDHVKMLGRTSDAARAALYNSTDIFLMPNIPVPHDMEGMGLVALEAASCGALVVASNLEGIPDAIQNGRNGVLVEAKNAAKLVQVIHHELSKRSIPPEVVRSYTVENYTWSKRTREYESAMLKLTSQAGH